MLGLIPRRAAASASSPLRVGALGSISASARSFAKTVMHPTEGRMVIFKNKLLREPVVERDLLMPQSPIITEWAKGSKRTGLLGEKMGMIHTYDHWGNQIILTVVQVAGCQVIQVKNEMTHTGQIKMVLGYGKAKAKRMTKPELVEFKKAGVEPKKNICEFYITPCGALPVGFELSSRHFVPGQFVDVSGITCGKGFAGGMKRWGYKGQRASHGVSLTHRSIGAIGGCQDPGKVWKGKKMPGRMGGKRTSMQNLKLFKIDTVRNLLFIKGTIPGKAGTFVRIKDAVRKDEWWNPDRLPPFPTAFPKDGEEVLQEIVMPAEGEDTFAPLLDE